MRNFSETVKYSEKKGKSEMGKNAYLALREGRPSQNGRSRVGPQGARLVHTPGMSEL